MVKLKTFEILVDNPGAVVKAGDLLRGQVILELSGDLDIVEIRVTFKGSSQVKWSGPQMQSSSPMAEVQGRGADQEQAEEVYFNHLLTLFPLAPADDSRRPSHQKLPGGRHQYDFEFDVPATCPHSFKGAHGVICYMLRAVVERTWKVDFNSRYITVLSVVDLNTIPQARDAVDLSGDLHIFNLFFRSGDCHATLRLPKKGFGPGEIIPAEFYVNNGSHQELHKVSLHLRMTVQYRAGREKCIVEVALGKVVLGKVPAGKTLEGRDRGLRVHRHCPPSGLPGCGLINVHYRVELKVKPAMLSLKRLKVTTDIIIGTTRLDISPYHDSPPDYQSCCPPSYEDVISSNQWMLPLPLHSPTPILGHPPPPPSPRPETRPLPPPLSEHPEISHPPQTQPNQENSPPPPRPSPLQVRAPPPSLSSILSCPDSHPLSMPPLPTSTLTTTTRGEPASQSTRVAPHGEATATPVSEFHEESTSREHGGASSTRIAERGETTPTTVPRDDSGLYEDPHPGEEDSHPMVQPRRPERRHMLVNDEPRVTVLRKANSPLSERPTGGEEDDSDDQPLPLIRPRANTGPPRRARRARGR